METSRDSGRDARRFQRYDIDCRVKVTYTRDNQKQFNYGRAQDLSFGGMLLTAPIKFQLGQRAEVEFRPPNMSEAVKLECVIRQKQGEYSYGVEFRNVTEAQRELIQRMFAFMHAIESTR